MLGTGLDPPGYVDGLQDCAEKKLSLDQTHARASAYSIDPSRATIRLSAPLLRHVALTDQYVDPLIDSIQLIMPSDYSTTDFHQPCRLFHSWYKIVSERSKN